MDLDGAPYGGARYPVESIMGGRTFVTLESVTSFLIRSNRPRCVTGLDSRVSRRQPFG